MGLDVFQNAPSLNVPVTYLASITCNNDTLTLTRDTVDLSAVCALQFQEHLPSLHIEDNDVTIAEPGHQLNHIDLHCRWV